MFHEYATKRFLNHPIPKSMLKISLEFVTRVLKFEFIYELMDTWEEFKNYQKDEELQKMIDQYREKYLLQGIKIFVNVVPVVMFCAIVVLTVKLDLTEASNLKFILSRVVLLTTMVVLDNLAKKYSIVLNNCLPIIMIAIGIVITNENISFKEPRIYDMWIPYQLLYFITSIIHCFDWEKMTGVYITTNVILVTRMMLTYDSIYFQFYLTIVIVSVFGPVVSLIVSKTIIDFVKLLQKHEKLLVMAKNILQVFPEGVIIRSKNINHLGGMIRFINDTAKLDFGESGNDGDNSSSDGSIAHGNFCKHEFVLKDNNDSQDSPGENSEPTLELKQVMEINEKKLIDTLERETESNIEMMHQNNDETSIFGAKYFTLKTILVNWEGNENAFMHVFVSTTDIKKLEKEKATNKCLHIMFSSVSHEFRTPLNSFENALTLLEAN